MVIVLGLLLIGLLIIGLIALVYYIISRTINRAKKPKENCLKCGTKLTPEDKFCPSCGKKV